MGGMGIPMVPAYTTQREAYYKELIEAEEHNILMEINFLVP
jgi:hypothetical protein